MEVEEKKQWMMRYRKAVFNIKKLSEKIEEIRVQSTSASPNTDGMPKGNKKMDLSFYVAEIEILEERKEVEKENAKKILWEILGKMQDTQDERYLEVLYDIYINGQTVEEIADKMGFDPRYIRKLHSDGLKMIGI